MPKKSLSLSAIRLDKTTQPRVRMDDEYVDELTELYKGECELPDPVVFWDGETYWCADGHHRITAALKAGLKGLTFEIFNGDRTAAYVYACGANQRNGLRPTNADKRAMVNWFLNNKEWKSKGDRLIGDTCGVSHTYVKTVRAQVAATGNVSSGDAETRTGRGGRKYKVKPKRGGEPSAEPQNGEEVFPHDTYFTALNTLRKLLDRMYVIHKLVNADKSVKRDPDWEGLSRTLEAFHAGFEKRWAYLHGKPFPKQ